MWLVGKLVLSNLKGPGFHPKHTRRLTKKKVKEVAGKFSNTDWTLPSKKEQGKTSGLRANTTNNNNKTLKKKRGRNEEMV